MTGAGDIFWTSLSRDTLPRGNAWLSPAELKVLERFHVLKRRSDWRLGRWCAKVALTSYLRREHRELPHDQIEIRAAGDGAPEAFLAGAPSGVHVSISHSAGRAACAVSAAPVGCDLEAIADSTVGLIGDFFTDDEQALVAAAEPPERALRATVIWSAKESVLKLERVGLRRDTRDVAITPEWGGVDGEWLPFSATSERVCAGWWMRAEGYVLAVAALSRGAPPIPLDHE